MLSIVTLNSRAWRALLALIAAFALLAAAVPAAGAAHLSWKKRIVTYNDVSPYGNSVNQAVQWINDMPGNLELRRSSPGYQPDIRISAVNRKWVTWAGVATVGWSRSQIVTAKVQLNKFWFATNSPAPDPLDASERAQVTAHELLHALGLPHMTGCTLMDPSRFVVDICGDADEPPAGKERCGPQRKDARALINRYGGKLGRFDGFFCPARASSGDDDEAEPAPSDG